LNNLFRFNILSWSWWKSIVWRCSNLFIELLIDWIIYTISS